MVSRDIGIVKRWKGLKFSDLLSSATPKRRDVLHNARP